MGFWARATTLLLLASCRVVAGFGWRRESNINPSRRVGLNLQPDLSASSLLHTQNQRATTYEIALHELQQLESEPLCHRTAARLLVNNCQLLEGKDEATVLTDSGRQIRDFVDAYAASLAICDLERGSFAIPRECTKFRESALNQLGPPETAQLHVSSKEIDSCLSGLGASDSAWNTWISYRHKALRFCEAARADNEKAEHIRLFQRLTKVMSTMTDGVEQATDKRMEDLDAKAQHVSQGLDNLSPRIDHIAASIAGIDSLISGDLEAALKQSTDTVNQGLHSAANLQRALEIMMQTILSTNAEAASAHEKSVELVTRKAETEIATVMSAMAAAVFSATTLQNQIEQSRLQAAELEYRQANVEEGMMRLADITENLSGKYNDHTQLLHQAQNMTDEILDALQDTAAAAAIVGDAFSKQPPISSWWPFIWCPAASLVMGSYGLPPSAGRNLGLVALGEFVGFMVSSAQSLSFDLPLFSQVAVSGVLANLVTAASPTAVTNSKNATITNFP
ncbi:hypothetical protein JX266_007748 [Neoarthrinium moseri]|nr:hypothetical protein JX266_007748 [Neoarthrinium moseri]